jgi:lysophospholipase L1-like esterase
MPLRRIAIGLTTFALFVLTAAAGAQDANTTFKFSFGPGQAASGYTQVSPDAAYSSQTGYGFENGSKPESGDRPFYFSVAAPEGNYKVTVTLGDAREPSTTTVKAEARRLMLESIHTEAGQFQTRSFTVNVRTPKISTGGEVGIDSREIGSPTWDDKLTIEFSGWHPSVSRMEIEKVDAITVFVLGDSTVTDQTTEPGGSWAQSLPRWFKPEVAVANHAESGETLKAFRRPAERRWDKVLSQLKPGDYVFMQFGTNDMKKHGNNNIYPDEDFSSTYAEANTEYKDLLEKYAGETRAKGATPVIVSPMSRRNLQNGKSVNTLGDYPKAAEAAAKEFGCPFIDLTALSAEVDEALGPDLVGRAFNDGTHPNTYGGYLLSRCMVEGIKQEVPDLAKYLVDDAGTFDPRHPEPMPDDFKLPPDPRPAGRGGRRGGPAATKPAR